MQQVKDFLKLIRFENIFFILLTQYMLRYFIVEPVFESFGKFPTLSDIDFFLLVFSTMLIAAAGYIINDYYDVKIDVVNKPQRLIIGKSIKRRTAMMLHVVFNTIGILIGFYLALKINNFKIGFTHFISAGLLWFYSTSYKRQLVIGNAVVSFLTALVVVIVGLYEPQLYRNLETQNDYNAAMSVMLILMAYAFFAFLISFIREIVKDMEDVKGDSSYGCKTLPLVLGMKKAKIITAALTIGLMAVIGYLQYHLLISDFIYAFAYILLLIQLPLLILLFYLKKGETQKDYHKMSILVKLVMLFGILTMSFYYFLFV